MKKILLIGGSLNQTTIVHQVGRHLENDFDCYYSPYYADGIIDYLAKLKLLNFTVLGPNSNFFRQTTNYLNNNQLKVDYKGKLNNYDLVITSSDLIVPRNIRSKKLLLIQEGMTDPENLAFYLVKYLKFPRWIASTSTTGLSDAYDYFCVASEGYRDLFIRKGVKAEKLVVTGIPNFDNVDQYRNNEFPYRNYVLAATSDARETFKFENRFEFIKKVVNIAEGRQIIFKLHPNEIIDRAIREIKEIVPDAIIFTDGDIKPMIANCDVLITAYSSVVYYGIALGKEVYSNFDLDTLIRMTPIQNGGTSALKIANVARSLITQPDPKEKYVFALNSHY